MKILIVCIQGITSNLLANKLTEYSASKYEYISVGASDIEKYFTEVDIIVLTPQVKNQYNILSKRKDIYGFKVYKISDNTLSLSNIPNTHNKIVNLIESDKSGIDKSTIYKLNKATLTFLLTYFVLIALLAVFKINFNLNFINEIYTFILYCMPFFAILRFGFEFGKLTLTSKGITAMVGLMTFLTFQIYELGVNDFGKLEYIPFLNTKLILNYKNMLLAMFSLIIYKIIELKISDYAKVKGYITSGYFSLNLIGSVFIYYLFLFFVLFIFF